MSYTNTDVLRINMLLKCFCNEQKKQKTKQKKTTKKERKTPKTNQTK